MSLVRGSDAASWGIPWRPKQSGLLVRSQSEFLRFVAGIRALFALLAGVALINYGVARSPLLVSLVTPYVLLAAALLWQTLTDPPRAHAERWLWVDAAVFAVLCQLMEHDAPWVGVIVVVPVVAMSVLAGPLHGLAMAVVSAAAMMWPGQGGSPTADWVSLPRTVPLVVLAFGPAAAFLAMPSRELRRRMQLQETFSARSDPRQGLLHNVDVLLSLLTAHFHLDAAVLSIQGPEPRIFRRDADKPTRLLDAMAASLWRERRAALPNTAGYLCSASRHRRVMGVHLEPFAGTSIHLEETAPCEPPDSERETLALPLVSYGRPLGHLCLMRSAGPFKVSDLHWLHQVMCELLPLLERSDLLEQLQRETAASERERIGRDLHDSAVQPYLGLKYGLEALLRQAGGNNPVTPHIQQLVDLTAQELRTLRDLVSGLRNGDDPTAATAFMQALRRQATRFEALYGLKVRIVAPDSLQLRGSIAKAVLHMFNEALTNVRRHTTARTVTVLFEAHDEQLVVRVRNDVGMRDDCEKVFTPRSLTERATEVGGGVTVHLQPDFTEVAIALPMFKALA
jgi:signal transduction histidine kinase